MVDRVRESAATRAYVAAEKKTGRNSKSLKIELWCVGIQFVSEAGRLRSRTGRMPVLRA